MPYGIVSVVLTSTTLVDGDLELAALQKQDPELFIIIELLETGTLPSDGKLAR